MGGRRRALLLLAGLSSCASESTTLTIDVRTDYLPGIEFGTVEVLRQSDTRDDSVRTHLVRSTENYVAGARVAEIDAAPGEYFIIARLIHDDGSRIAERGLLLQLEEGVTGITVVITRNCEDVYCGTISEGACLNGSCVDPACSPDNLAACGDVFCNSAADCFDAPAACAETVCEESVCLVRPRPASCEADEYCDPTLGCRERPQPAIDAGLVDAGMDAGMDGGADSGLDGGFDSGFDAGLDAPPLTCECADPAATCDCSRGTCRCLVTVANCGVTAMCPTGYTCVGGGTCECSSPTICGVYCDTTADCEARLGALPQADPPWICDDVDGVCREKFPCRHDQDCGPTEFCGEEFRCLRRGSTPDGATCRDALDCTSGRCSLGTCLSACESSAECSSGLACEQIEVDAPWLGCQLPGDCRDDVCATDEHCASYHNCAVSCLTTGDCPATMGCYFQSRGPLYCSNASPRCRNDEIHRDGGCVTAQRCWLDADRCPAGFTCVSSPIGSGRQVGFCFRDGS